MEKAVAGTPAPTEREATPVTLSTGEWFYLAADRARGRNPWHEPKHPINPNGGWPMPSYNDGADCTASDHRAIADVLDPAAAPSDTPPSDTKVGGELWSMVRRALTRASNVHTHRKTENERQVWLDALASRLADDVLARAVSLPAPHSVPIGARLLAVDVERFDHAPCYLCGYNGAGYYQPDTHPCAERYHATLNGMAERRSVAPHSVPTHKCPHGVLVCEECADCAREGEESYLRGLL